MVVFTIVQALVLGLLIGLFYRPTAINPVEASTKIKHERLATAPSPRAIFVGGSNLLFGLDSERVERETSYHPVNMGVIGGLRLRYLLNETLANVRRGDLVVLGLEYQSVLSDPEVANLQVLASIIESRPANARYLSWPQWRRMLDRGVIEYGGQLIRGIRDGMKGRAGGRRVYDAINVYGDLTLYHEQRSPARHEVSVMLGRRLRERSLERGIEALNAFHTACRERGVDVVYSYPPVSQYMFDRREQVLEDFHRILVRDCTIPVIMPPGEMVLPDKFNIDGRYHVWGRGVKIRTQRLIDAIRAYLETGGRPPSEPPNVAEPATP